MYGIDIYICLYTLTPETTPIWQSHAMCNVNGLSFGGRIPDDDCAIGKTSLLVFHGRCERYGGPRPGNTEHMETRRQPIEHMMKTAGEFYVV